MAEGELSTGTSELRRMLVVWWVDRCGGAPCWIPIDWAILICIGLAGPGPTDLLDTAGTRPSAELDRLRVVKGAGDSGVQVGGGVLISDSTAHFDSNLSLWYSR